MKETKCHQDQDLVMIDFVIVVEDHNVAAVVADHEDAEVGKEKESDQDTMRIQLILATNNVTARVSFAAKLSIWRVNVN